MAVHMRHAAGGNTDGIGESPERCIFIFRVIIKHISHDMYHFNHS